MYLIKGITSDPKQIQDLILPNGKTATLRLEYKPMQLGWFMSLTYGDFSVTNIRVVSGLNFLRQFKNLIPFGMACFNNDGHDPLLIQDFLSGRSELFIIDASEVVKVEDYLGGKVSA
jgi:hypothetical protein